MSAQEPFFLQPRKGVVDSTDGELPTGDSLEKLPDAQPVRFFVELGHRQQHADFEFPEPIAFRHVCSTS